MSDSKFASNRRVGVRDFLKNEVIMALKNQSGGTRACTAKQLDTRTALSGRKNGRDLIILQLGLWPAACDGYVF